MAYRCLGVLRSWAPALLVGLAAAACSPAYVAADGDTDDSGGSSTDGSAGSGGSTGGSEASGGEPGTGGSDGESGGTSNSGGTGMGTGGADASCDESEECIAAANFDDECFSPSCSAPVAATASEVEQSPCLVPWEDREDLIPEECAAHDSEVACPAICEIQPPCVDAACAPATGECVIEICLK